MMPEKSSSSRRALSERTQHRPNCLVGPHSRPAGIRIPGIPPSCTLSCLCGTAALGGEAATAHHGGTEKNKS